MKKAVTWLLLAILFAFLAGCSNNNENSIVIIGGADGPLLLSV